MRSIILLFALCVSIFAQPTLTLSAPASVDRGKALALTLTLSGVPDSSIVGYQRTIGGSDLLKNSTITLAPPLTPSKNIYNLYSDAAKKHSQIVIGMNATVIPPGLVETIQVPIPANAPLGPVTFALSQQEGVDEPGNLIPFELAAPVTVNITFPGAKCDLNADNVIDSKDLIIMTGQILGQMTGLGPACTTADLDKDGKCNMRDARILTTAAGGACTAQ